MSLVAELNAMAREYFSPVVTDNFFRKRFLLNELWTNHKKTIKGGRSCVWDLEYEENPNYGSYTEFGEFKKEKRDKLTYATETWISNYLNIPLSKKRINQCQGDQQVVDYMAFEMKNAEKTLRKRYTFDLWAAGAAYAHNGEMVYPIKGMQKICAQDRIYGGIDSTTFAWWDAQYKTYGGTPTWGNLIDSSSAYYILTILGYLMTLVVDEGDYPDLIIVSEAPWEALQVVGGLQQQYVQGPGGSKSASANFQFGEMSFRDNIRIVYDPDCPAGEIYVLASEYLTLYTLAGETMDFTGFKDPGGGDTIEGAYLLTSVLACSNCRCQARAIGLPANAY